MTTVAPAPRLPIVSLVIAAIAVAGMVAWSVVQWPDMAESIVTREAAGSHGASVVPRGVTAAAMPIALAVLTAVLALAPALDRRLAGAIRRQSPAGERNAARVLGAFVIGLSILLPVVHVALVGMHTGAALPISTMIGSAAGLVLVILGAYLPLARPDAETRNGGEEAFRAALGPAIRGGGFALIVVGIATIAVALIAPAFTIVVAPVGVALVFAGIAAAAFLRARRV